MLPQLASTAASFTRASSLMLKAGTDAHLYDDPHDADISRLLDSRFDAEKVEALKRLLALTAQGVDVSAFFPQVVKNVASSSLEAKKLVYIYLLQYAEKRPDEALLSVNTFQKDLVDFNPLVRAWALRAMCGIGVHAVTPLMIMAIQKCARDPSSYVRCCAANAIPKLYALNRDQYIDTLEELICLLLDDKSAGVLGAATAAYTVVCPENFSIITPRFRGLCNTLSNVEEWGQVLLVDVLLRYVVAQNGYDKERAMFSTGIKTADARLENSIPKGNGEDKVFNDEMPQNTRLLLQCTLGLLQSHNSAVMLAAVGVHWLLAPEAELKKIVKPLLFLLRSSYDCQYVVLLNVLTLVQAKASLFEDYYEDFFIRASDIPQIREIKLNILALIATQVSITAILRELQVYVRDLDRNFAAKAVSVIGKCAGRHPSIAGICMDGLLNLARGSQNNASSDGDLFQLKKTEAQKSAPFKKAKELTCMNGSIEDREASVVTQAVLAIRYIASLHFKDVEKVFARLVRDLDLIHVAGARSVVIWMIGEYGSQSDLIKSLLPAVFSYLAACFVNEDIDTKLQILNCIPKVVVRSLDDLSIQSKTSLLALSYILDLGSCDVNYDVRDRARLLKQIMGLHIKATSQDVSEILNISLVKVVDENACKNLFMMLPNFILNSEKQTPSSASTLQDRIFLLGSMSHIVNHCAPGYRPLPAPCSLTDIDQSTLHPCSSEGISVIKQMIDEESDYCENYSPDTVDTNSDSDDNPQSKGYKSDTGLICSDVSGSDSIGSGEESQDNASYQSNATRNKYLDEFKLISLSDDDEENSISFIANGQGVDGESDSKIVRSLVEVRSEPLICLSDNEEPHSLIVAHEQAKDDEIDSTGLTLRSTEDLESWFADDSFKSKNECEWLGLPTGYATITLDPIITEPMKMSLLDFTNGGGLEVKYSYCFAVQASHPQMVWLKLHVTNKSQELLSTIYVSQLESDATSSSAEIAKDAPTKFSVNSSQTIPTLYPGKMVELDMFVDFHQQLASAKLDVFCNMKHYPVRLVPDIGAFLRPKELTVKDFSNAESKLVGMFEILQRSSMVSPIHPTTTESDEVFFFAKTIATRVVSHINVALVAVIIPVSSGYLGDDYTDVHLKFSGETLVESKLCLISVALEPGSPKASEKELPFIVKVNCEDSIFAQNLLKRLQKAVSENK